MNCPICSNNTFNQSIVIESRLIDEWELKPEEVNYINKQQGYYCTKCFCNLRSMTLADAMMKHFNYSGTFNLFFMSRFGRRLNLLEINEAGNLHQLLSRFRHYTFAEYPKIDIQMLPYNENTYDCIVHSDTLEHVPNSLLALKECWRVLKVGGVLIYTIPIISGRLTRSRKSMSNSYHGVQNELQGEDFKVFTEYGADFWVELINAGFTEITINSLENHASLAISAKKSLISKYKVNFIDSFIVKVFRKCQQVKKNIFK